jgi:monovalent cation:H+ antiporter, CPA1 family
MGIVLWLGALVQSEEMTVGNVQLVVLLLSITLVVSLVARRIGLPYTLVLVIVGLLIGFSPFLYNIQLNPALVLFFFLPALLFEGAWNVDTEQLIAEWFPVLLLSIPGLLIAILFMAIALHIGIGLAWMLAILLGAIVSPTDPIAALALFKQLGVAERLFIAIEGESLFNDGIGTAVFDVVLGFLLPSLGLAAISGHYSSIPPVELVLHFLWLLLGGPLLGLLLGWCAARFLRLIDDHLIETTVTFSVAYGSYLMGSYLHTSGLLSVVGAGLVMGSYGRHQNMSQRTQEAAQDVWEFIAYLSNSLLFLLLGIQIGASNFFHALPGILWAVLGIVAGRFFIVYTLMPLHDFLARRLARRHRRLRLLPTPQPLPRAGRPLLVLTGLRGALSIALVLSLPIHFVERSLMESIVYGVVLITLLGQGLVLRFLLPHWPAVTETNE